MEIQREEAVWDRVLGQRRQGMDLDGLLRESASLAAVYRQASEHMAGRRQVLARQLLQTEEDTLRCLRGMAHMLGQKSEALKIWKPNKSSKGLLETSYHRSRQLMVEYTARSAGPEFGECYRILAERTAEQCEKILRLLGSA